MATGLGAGTGAVLTGAAVAGLVHGEVVLTGALALSVVGAVAGLVAVVVGAVVGLVVVVVPVGGLGPVAGLM